jgi:hypothetical protein
MPSLTPLQSHPVPFASPAVFSDPEALLTVAVTHAGMFSLDGTFLLIFVVPLDLLHLPDVKGRENSLCR